MPSHNPPFWLTWHQFSHSRWRADELLLWLAITEFVDLFTSILSLVALPPRRSRIIGGNYIPRAIIFQEKRAA